MKFLLLNLFLFFILLLHPCLPQDISLKYNPYYRAVPLPVDTTIPSHALKVIGRFPLQENDSVTLSDIYSAASNPDGTKAVLIDRPGCRAIMYDLKTGRIIKSIQTDLNLSYEVGKKAHRPFYKNNGISYKYFVGDEDYKKRGYKPFLLFVKNTFYICKWFENKIIISTKIYTPGSEDLADDKISPNINFGNRCAFVIYDENLNYITMIIPEGKFDLYPEASNFEFFKDGSLFANANNSSAMFQDTIASHFDPDSIITYGLFSSNGKIIDRAGNLPDKYVFNNLDFLAMGYNYLHCTTTINDSIFLIYPYDNDVYGMNNKFRFKLKNIPFNNDSGLRMYANYLHTHNWDTVKKMTLIKDWELMTLLPVKAISLLNIHNHLVVISRVFDKFIKQKIYYIFQEYDPNGNLITQSYIDDEPGYHIQAIFYDAKNNYLCFVKKGLHFTVIEKRIWG